MDSTLQTVREVIGVHCELFILGYRRLWWLKQHQLAVSRSVQIIAEMHRPRAACVGFLTIRAALNICVKENAWWHSGATYPKRIFVLEECLATVVLSHTPSSRAAEKVCVVAWPNSRMHHSGGKELYRNWGMPLETCMALAITAVEML